MDKKLTVGIFFYNQPDMVRKQVLHWRQLAHNTEVIRDVEVLFIDDCSHTPITHEFISMPEVDYRLIRVLDDIPWNWGVKNLVWTQAHSDWVFFNDCDYFFDAPTLEKMVNLATHSEPGNIYFFKHGGCKNLPEKWKHWKKDWPAAQYLANKADVERAGGYNEDLAGRRGYDDELIKAGYDALGIKRNNLPDYTVWMDWDGRTEGLNRDSTANRVLFDQLKKDPINKGSILRFEFEEVPKDDSNPSST